MTRRTASRSTAGLAGPAAVWAGALLIAAAPLVRGGNRFIALIVLEWMGLSVLAALVMHIVLRPAGDRAAARLPAALLFVLASPALFAALQLTPVSPDWWFSLPGHAAYLAPLQGLGLPVDSWRPVSLLPDATRASLLAAIPVLAAFLLGYLTSVRQLRSLMRVLVGVALAEILLGLLQISGGQHSPLYFGMMSYGVPIGTFSNRNLFANYVALALAAYVWLAYDAIRYTMRLQPGAPMRTGTFDNRHAVALWVVGGLVLVTGILMTRSRGGALFGLGAAFVSLAAAGLRVFGWSRGWRFALPVTLVLIAGASGLVGLDAVSNRFASDQVTSSASFRGLLARSSLEGAWAFFPFGSGWGTYEYAYQQFQPPRIAGYANNAHMDYIEMLFEGGLLFVLVAAALLWVAVKRAGLLARTAWHRRTLSREAMAAALCGIGLLGFLLHALVDFPMRIPANAIVAALLAGAFLRPLDIDRPASPTQPKS